MSRQKTGPLLPAAGFRQYLVYKVPRHQAGQHPDPYPVGQPPISRDYHLAALLFAHTQKITDKTRQ